MDVTNINVAGTFYYLCSLLDGSSRFIVHWEIRTSMTEPEIEIITQQACERYPDTRPPIISDNGPQFIARDFKEFIRICRMIHVRTSLYYSQSNGRIERWHRSQKSECIRPGVPLLLEGARHFVYLYIDHYNNMRLHSFIGYIALADKLAGRSLVIFADRDRKLEATRERRERVHVITRSTG